MNMRILPRLCEPTPAARNFGNSALRLDAWMLAYWGRRLQVVRRYRPCSLLR